MRFGIMWMAATAAVGFVGTLSSVGCGDGGGSGGSAGSAGSAGSGPSCDPSAACLEAEIPGSGLTAGGGVVVPECLGFADNTGAATFGLRMAQLTVTSPPALSSGIVADIVANGVYLDNGLCRLAGTGTFNWLIEVDTATGDVTTGGGKPVDVTSGGYSFVNEMVAGQPVAPVVLAGAFDGTAINAATGMDVNVPIYLDAAGTMVVLLPLKGAKLTGATLSAGNSCVGQYNSDTLTPANSCLPDPSVPGDALFTDVGNIEGFITIAGADGVIVDTLNQSLCVLLAGPSEADMGSPKHCKTDPVTMEYTAMGDWCSTTNMPADANCHDAFHLTATFAAQSVTIN